MNFRVFICLFDSFQRNFGSSVSQTVSPSLLSVEEEAAAAAMIRRLDFEESSLRQLQSGWGGYTTLIAAM